MRKLLSILAISATATASPGCVVYDDGYYHPVGIVATIPVGHVCGPYCGHYWYGGNVYFIEGHRHYDGCGHVFVGGREFGFTFIEELVDVMGNFAGTAKVRVKLTVTDKDEFVGVSNLEERSAAGVVTAIRCGTIRGARIKVEPLAPQCQNVTPPQ